MSGHQQLMVLAAIATWSAGSQAAIVPPPEVLARLAAGQDVELIVEFGFDDLEGAAMSSRVRAPRGIEDAAALRNKADAYRQRKARVRDLAGHVERDDLRDYSHLPMSFHRFRSRQALEALITQPEVRAIHANTPHFTSTAQSLPLIGQPPVLQVGAGGSGTTVAVIDTGVDIANAAFGGCTAPGQPAGCRIAAMQTFGTGSASNHGTNVAAIVAAVAPAARIAALDVFSGNIAFAADIIDAINWSIANRTTYNIVALNLSLGDGIRHVSPCGPGSAYFAPVANARAVGLSVVAASGNEAFADGLGSPACTVGATSVGAVYDANVGGLAWGGGLCTDTTTAADRIACFSNSAAFLHFLAPGALITAGGITMGGTSQAAPHVAGALAVLAGEYPGETHDQLISRLLANGRPILDARNGVTKPRVDLLAAARPENDAFAGRIAIAGPAGTVTADNGLASREAGEPPHAGNGGGRSLWWTMIPAASGQLSIDTAGSTFDTLLAVYSGSAVNALTALIANDNTGDGSSAILLQVAAGVPLSIAVDGFNGAAGDVSMHWSLDVTAAADLAIDVSGPTSIGSGANATWSVTLHNFGPNTATHARASLALPSGAAVAALPTGCVVATAIVGCDAGTLSVGSVAAFPIGLAWTPGTEAGVLQASAASDLPDGVVGNNAASLAVVIAATGSGDSADVPVPPWALLLLGGLLFGRARRVTLR